METQPGLIWAFGVHEVLHFRSVPLSLLGFDVLAFNQLRSMLAAFTTSKLEWRQN
jgi:hypothetical protein